MKKKILALLLIGVLASTSLTGCFASMANDIKHDGSFFGTTDGDYVVLNESGGQIMDVYLLKNQFVKSESGSDGLSFVDNNGDPVKLQGDCVSIRINNQKEFDNYVEYHRQFDLIPYEDFYKEKKGIK